VIEHHGLFHALGHVLQTEAFVLERLGAVVVDAGMHHDAADPTLQRAFHAKAVQLAEHAYEAFLQEVGGFQPMAGIPEADGVHAP